jgi:hypothetical protein
MRWLTQLDPDVPVSVTTCGDQVGGGVRMGPEGSGRAALEGETPLPGDAPAPVAGRAPTDAAHGGRALRGSDDRHDERTLYALLGYAQRLATTGRSSTPPCVIEAVACNPTASFAVQRRCRRLDRRWIPCHYLRGGDRPPSPRDRCGRRTTTRSAG